MTKRLRKRQIVVIQRFNFGNNINDIVKINEYHRQDDCGLHIYKCEKSHNRNKEHYYYELDPRPATEAEKKAYRKGITNIKDIK